MFGPVSQIVGIRDKFMSKILKKPIAQQKVQLQGGKKKEYNAAAALVQEEKKEEEEIISFPISGSRIYDFIRQDETTIDLIRLSYKTEMERRSVLWGNIMEERVAIWFRESFCVSELLDTATYYYAADPTISSKPDYIVKLKDSWYFLEIKCPYTQSLPPTTNTRLPNRVYCQVQSHLNCYASNNYPVQIKGCLVIYWSLMGSIIYLVRQDEKFWNDYMLPNIRKTKQKMLRMNTMMHMLQPTSSTTTTTATNSYTNANSSSSNMMSDSASTSLSSIIGSNNEEAEESVSIVSDDSENNNIPTLTMSANPWKNSSSSVSADIDAKITEYQTRDYVTRLYVFVFHTREVKVRVADKRSGGGGGRNKRSGRVDVAMQKMEKYYETFDRLEDLSIDRLNKAVALGANLLY